MEFTTWSTAELMTFFLVLVRISVLLVLLPIFGDKMVPTPVKILLSLALSIILFPILKDSGVVRVETVSAHTNSTGALLMLVGLEVLVGLIVGFVSQLVFQAIHIAGDFISQMMGLSMASMFDPHMEQQTMVLSQMLSALAMLTFLAIDGHHIMLQALIESFRYIPQGGGQITEMVKNSLVQVTGNVMLFGIQLAAPIALCMLLVNMVYGVIGKALPQLNILTLSLAVGVLVGSIVLLLSYPSFQSGVANIFDASFDSLKGFMVVYGGK